MTVGVTGETTGNEGNMGDEHNHGKTTDDKSNTNGKHNHGKIHSNMNRLCCRCFCWNSSDYCYCHHFSNCYNCSCYNIVPQIKVSN